MERFEGVLTGPWDEIAISYVLTCTHVALEKPGEAFKEYTQLVSCVLPVRALVLHFPDQDFMLRSFSRFFTENGGWTLPALFSILKSLRDLAFDVRVLVMYDQFNMFTCRCTGRHGCKI